MNASTHDQPRYYGSLFNLEHRVMSGAVLTLAAIVLVLFGEEGRAVQANLALETPAAKALAVEPGGWVRPAEIRVHAPVVSHPILDDRLLERFRLLEPPQAATLHARQVTATDAQLIVVPARPVAVQVGPPDVAAFRLGESLAPSGVSGPVANLAPLAPANGRIGR